MREITRKRAIEVLEYLISEDCTDTQHDYIQEIDRAIELLRRDAEGTRAFRVIGTKTGKEADTYEIALHDEGQVEATECVGREAAIKAILKTTAFTEDELRAMDRQVGHIWISGVSHGLIAAIDVIRGMEPTAVVLRRYDANEYEDEEEE